MTRCHLLAATALMTLALAACGGPPEEANPATDTAAVDTAAVPATDAAATPVDGETPAPDASATPGAAGATPTPTASASTPAPAAAVTRPAVAVAPPASFTTCTICHSVSPGQNGVGPSLAGVFGRRAGSLPGATYSPAMDSSNVTWNDGTLDRYLADPNAVVPGTLMPPPGLDAAQRRAIIDYLKTL